MPSLVGSEMCIRDSVHIPYEDEQTLYDVITKRFEQEKTEIGVGASTFFDNFGLRVAKMHNGKISRIEVIRSIHWQNFLIIQFSLQNFNNFFAFTIASLPYDRV